MVGDISFQKMYGLYGLKHHIVEISGDVTDAGRTTTTTTTSKDRATQLLICEALSFATKAAQPEASPSGSLNWSTALTKAAQPEANPSGS